MDQQAVIVGGGQAAHCAAFAMRQAGYKGRIILLGEEAAAPYERPPLSKEALVADVPVIRHFCQPSRYEEKEIELRLGQRVEAIDPDSARLRLEGGEQLAYDALLLATGGRARQLDIPGGEHVRYLRTHQDSLALRAEISGARHVVCIGAGVIGLEVAASARALGARVTVVEASSTIMGRCLASDDAAFIRELHEKAEVAMRCGTQVVCVEADRAGKRVTLGTGDVLIADCVVAGIGILRNTELAEGAGLLVDNGILVDDGGRTSMPGIYAAGDVTAFFHPVLNRCLRLESFYHAQGQGAVVGRMMAGAASRYEDIPRFWTDQYDVNLQVAGSPLHGVRTVLRGSREEGRFTAIHIGDDGRVVGVTAANNPREMRPALDLIRRGGRPDEVALADERVPLDKMAA